MPQATRNDDHYTYRCYRRGPDGVLWVFALRTWGMQNVDGRTESVNACPGESAATTGYFLPSAQSHQAPSMCSNSGSPPGTRRLAIVSKR